MPVSNLSCVWLVWMPSGWLQQKFIFKALSDMDGSASPSKQEDSPYFNQIIDFRNGRYQGSADIYSRRPYGRGMFLDENYLFVLSDWVNGVPSGKCFAIYPDHHILYGSLYEGKTSKLCAYKQPGKYTIFLKHFINENNLVIIDDYVSQSLLVLYLNYKEWAKQTQLKKNNMSIFVEGQASNHKFIDVVDHKVYLTSEEKWRIIEEYSKEKVGAEYRNYSVFVNSSFASKQQSLLISSQNATQYELSYEGSSIICKINKNEKVEEDYAVKMIGIYDQEEQQFELYKRSRGKQKVEEFVRGYHALTYEQRPKQCQRKMRQFFKQSTIFYNGYVPTTSFYHIKHLFMALSQYVDYFLTNKYAQTFLCSSSHLATHQHHTLNFRKIDAGKLKDMQEDILRAARKKSSPGGSRISNYASLYENDEGVFARVKRFSKDGERNYNWLADHSTHSKHAFKQPTQSLISFQANHESLSNRKWQQDTSKGDMERTQWRRVRPLEDITSNQTSKVNMQPPINYNLAQLAEDLISIQLQLKRQALNTPTKLSKATHRSQLTTQPAPFKMSTLKSSQRGNQLQTHNYYCSPVRGRKSAKASWR